MADPKNAPEAPGDKDPKAPFVGDLLPSNAAGEGEEPMTWEEIDAAADQALAHGDELARKGPQ
ncbi:MAG: hypothetical protein KY468_10960 [Armatimonadetes bacterium]|nr:hypothetical protein [Armatimonadota bacterium]